MPRLTVDRQNASFFDPSNEATSQALMQAQYDPSSPQVPQLVTATDLIVPDYRVDKRLEHFPSDLYDLRPESHLSRFLKALLGDSGAGAGRRRYLIARMQSSLATTHFYDLDRFYGAVFGAQRYDGERLPINPYTEGATPWEWEEIHAADTGFRERLLALAKAIPMGGTPVGLKAAAEALTGVECDILESWRVIDYSRAHNFDIPGAPRSYNRVEATFGNYEDMGSLTWDDISFPGGAEQSQSQATFPGDRAEVRIRIKKRYDDSERLLREKAQDEYAVRQVLNRLKPANVLLTLDTLGVNHHQPVDVAEVYSDSTYYDVIARVTPRVSATVDLSPVYPVSRVQRAAGVFVSDPHVVPRPPFSTPQGAQWSYNNEVVSIRGSVLDEAGALVATQNAEFVTDAQGQHTVYSPEKGLLDARQVEAARLVSDGVMVSSPYAGDRQVVQTHD
jgi:hypothetical protein